MTNLYSTTGISGPHPEDKKEEVEPNFDFSHIHVMDIKQELTYNSMKKLVPLLEDDHITMD